MHVIVTDQHCQRQTSSCIDIASLDSYTPIVKVRTLHRRQAQLLTTPTTDQENANIHCGIKLIDCIQKGSPHRLCSLTANTEVCTPPVLPIAVCVSMRNVCCKELHWLFSAGVWNCLQNRLAIRRHHTHRVV